jgi:type II secretory pathway component PulK
MMPATKKGAKNDAGFALFVVLSFLLIAAAITVPFLTNARIDALVSRNAGQFTHEKVLLRGLLQVTALRYFELYQNAQTRPATAVDCNFAELSLNLNIQDHSGLIDLNAASVDVLSLGFQSFDIPTETAQILANNVVKYRSVDNLAAAQPGDLAVRNGYKSALFEHVAELHDLLVAANVSIKNIDTVFTIHSGTGTVDEAAAPKQLLALIERRPAVDRYFIVNDTRRTNAITVSASIKRLDAPRTFAKAIFGRGQNELGLVSLSPVNLARTSERGPDLNRDAPVACEAFFDPQILQVLQEAVS